MKTILIVEDNAALVRLYSKWLQQPGSTLFQAETAEEALTQLQTVVPDMVVLDINLPDGSSLPIIEQLKSDPDFQHTEVVLISGMADLPKEIKAAGVTNFLRKPVSINTLMDLANHLPATAKSA